MAWFVGSAAPSRVEFEAQIMLYVITICIMAVRGGLMFGYDIGISGNVLLFTMEGDIFGHATLCCFYGL